MAAILQVIFLSYTQAIRVISYAHPGMFAGLYVVPLPVKQPWRRLAIKSYESIDNCYLRRTKMVAQHNLWQVLMDIMYYILLNEKIADVCCDMLILINENISALNWAEVL